MIADPREHHLHHAEERAGERLQMVRDQLEHPDSTRLPVRDPHVLRAMREVPRHRFLPNPDHPCAYGDGPLAIDCGQTISQPYIVAIMTQFLGITASSRVLEVGTGSGYQAAVLACITPHVFTVEVIPELAEKADVTLADLGFDAVHRRCSDGAIGWPEEAPFDAILVACAMKVVPRSLLSQLRTGGRFIAPVESARGGQHLVLGQRLEDGRLESRRLMAVSFVPMVGPSQRK